MRIFAMSDFHLSLSGEKPMDKFGSHWTDHPERIVAACRERIDDNDLFLIPGDHSWGLKLEDATEDLELIASLPGRKVLCRGNHDYWWQGISKIRKRFPTLTFLQNDAITVDGRVSICGTRGWTLPGTPGYSAGKDEKYLEREVARLKLSVGQLDPKADLKIALIHYPPLFGHMLDTPFSEILSEAKIDLCVYGHLHLSSSGTDNLLGFNGRHRKVRYQLVSCDTLGFVPWQFECGERLEF